MIFKNSGNINFAKQIVSVSTSFNIDFSSSTVSIGDSSLRGDGVNFSGKLAKISAMGEYMERYVQSTVSHKIKNKYQEAFNVNTGQVENVHILDMIIPKYLLFEEGELREWNDSSGTAFHVSSMKVIDNAFQEFIERQSLVHCWLTKSPGKKISLELCGRSNDQIRKAHSALLAYFDSIESYEISITEKCKVVITIATSKLNKSVGLGSSWELESALFKSLKETWQLISHKAPAHMNSEYDKYTEEVPDTNKGFNLYGDYFHELSVEEVKKSYEFLDDGEIFKFVENPNFIPDDGNYLETLKKIGEDLNIELLITYVPSIIENLPGHVVKIIGKGAFPHIKTDIINHHEYSIKEINKVKDVPNKGVMIPFS